MQKLINPIQHYSWGSRTAFTELFGLDNPTQQPQAELWMGAHPNSSSQIILDDKQQLLSTVIAQHPRQLLGDTIAQRYGELPFLFKLLSAAEPLSIQVHPDKQTAQQGYLKEETQGIAVTASQRNYKDKNHKPELIYALTPFIGMNGFRPIADIINLFEQANITLPELTQLKQQATPASLLILFHAILTLNGEKQQLALQKLKHAALSPEQPWQSIKFIEKFYPNDNGLFCPLLLNVIELQPGEAMYLAAQTPHAYLYGTGLEIMANSDNVLRAGLTSKHIDITELIKNTNPISQQSNEMILTPTITTTGHYFHIPVADFGFAIHYLTTESLMLSVIQPAIFFCCQGEINFHSHQQQLTLMQGESCFIDIRDYPLTLTGSGTLAEAYTPCS